MTRSANRVTLLLAAVLLSCIFCVAQTPDPEHEKLASERLEEISAHINLTADQKEKVKPILMTEAEKLKALKEDTSLTRRKRFQKLRVIMDETSASLKPILTPDQLKTLQKMRDDAVRKRMTAR
jgi:Spy/CpxP family protein refolding chaperone